MKRRRSSQQAGSSKRKNYFLGALVVFLTIIASVLFLIIGAAGILKKEPYFTVKDVIVLEGNKSDFSHLIGRNIFDIDLKGESEYISQEYPSYKKIRLVRVFPDKIFVDFKKRVPVAYLKMYRIFFVDEDGVLLDIPADQAPGGVPAITGLETKIFAPKTGTKYNSEELKFALNILRQLKANRLMRGYAITRIDVSRPSQVSVFISDTLEIKISMEKSSDMLSILPGLLSQARNDLGNIQYVDLRFDEPVIKFKNDAKK